MFGKSLLKSVAVSSLGVLAVSQAAQAALSVDLRMVSTSQPAGSVISADGKTITIPANVLTPVRMQIWVTVTGQSGNALHEGLNSVFSSFNSSNPAGGIAGGITFSNLSAGMNGNGSGVGLSSNNSNDGIGDWGNVSDTPTTVDTTMGYYRARTGISVGQVDFGYTDPGPDEDNPKTVSPVAASNIHQLADGGIEFMIGTIRFTPTAAPGGSSVKYSPALPTGGANSTAGWAEDSDENASSPTGLKSNATGTAGPVTPNASLTGGITISYVPEPTSLGFLGLGALGVLRRRRA